MLTILVRLFDARASTKLGGNDRGGTFHVGRSDRRGADNRGQVGLIISHHSDIVRGVNGGGDFIDLTNLRFNCREKLPVNDNQEPAK